MRSQTWEINVCHYRTYPVSRTRPRVVITPYIYIHWSSPSEGQHARTVGGSFSSQSTHSLNPFYFLTRKREIRCMDLGQTALGNWKAQQGGCTHIQVSHTCSPT